MGIITLVDQSVWRSPEKTGFFRVGCVYSPLDSVHPGVVIVKKGFFSAVTVQAKVDAMVYTATDVMTVTLKAGTPPRFVSAPMYNWL